MYLKKLQNKVLAIVDDASHVFEWSNEKKAQLVLYFAALMSGYALLGLALIYQVNYFIDLTSYVRFKAVFIGIVILAAYVMIAFYLIKIGNSIIKHQRKNDFFVAAGLMYYLGGNLILLYLMGFHSLMTGIYVSGSSTVGILLFGKRVVLPLTYLAILGGSILYAMSFVDIIAYSALVPNPGNNHNNIVWLMAVSNMAVPHVAIFIFIANVSVNRWREREQHAKYLSETDVLTNISNRRHFIEQLNKQYRRTAKHGGTFSLLMMDLDNFKMVNDTYGHHIGDQLLIATTEVIKSCIRTKDILGRYGGEEFVVLLPNTESPAALISAERCCERISQQRFSVADGQELSLQVSIGCVTSSDITMQHPPEHLLWLADEALLQAKASGKNCVVTNADHAQQPDANQRHRFRTS